MFQRGHLDHVALGARSAADFETLRQRLVDRGATDGTIEDLGAFHSLWFVDPDGKAVPAVPEPMRPKRLGWETIRARNAELANDADTPACGWDGGRIDLVACIDDLVRADDRAHRVELG